MEPELTWGSPSLVEGQHVHHPRVTIMASKMCGIFAIPRCSNSAAISLCSMRALCPKHLSKHDSMFSMYSRISSVSVCAASCACNCVNPASLSAQVHITIAFPRPMPHAMFVQPHRLPERPIEGALKRGLGSLGIFRLYRARHCLGPGLHNRAIVVWHSSLPLYRLISLGGQHARLKEHAGPCSGFSTFERTWLHCSLGESVIAICLDPPLAETGRIVEVCIHA